MRIESCNVLAHDLRNPIMKLGFIASAINTEIAFFRELWEDYLVSHVPGLSSKKELLQGLNRLALEIQSRIDPDHHLYSAFHQIVEYQRDLIVSNYLPEKAIDKIDRNIIPLWSNILDDLMSKGIISPEESKAVLEKLNLLKEAVYYGIRDEIIKVVNHIPEDFKEKWVDLAYREFSFDNIELLNELIALLDKAPIEVPHHNHIRKNLFYLKTLAEVVQELNSRVATIIETLKNTRPVISWMMEPNGKDSDDSEKNWC
jgi:hypothetical protein